uniref:Ovule protein n=1 Tax=Ascaris lumbricoides TaxID=6252 RepID=A0A0M3IT03_ASCLU
MRQKLQTTNKESICTSHDSVLSVTRHSADDYNSSSYLLFHIAANKLMVSVI